MMQHRGTEVHKSIKFSENCKKNRETKERHGFTIHFSQECLCVARARGVISATVYAKRSLKTAPVAVKLLL